MNELTHKSSLARSVISADGPLIATPGIIWGASLEVLVPPDTIVISAGEEKWKNQADILESADKFHAAGGKLVRLEFPRTEIQRFGDVAITYSQYLYETEVDGKRSITSGRVTEVFVLRNGHWTNPGWHTDTEMSQAAYPVPARSANIQGTVEVGVEIGIDGKVLWANASGANPYLVEAAKQNARQ